MMENAAVCVNGNLDTAKYASPMPIIGLYIAVATLVCFFSMAFDLCYGFVRRKPYLPCKLFPINSFTLIIVAVATKIPFDLTTSMPRDVDQLSKLTSTALLCISLGYFLPSLGNMSGSERYANMAALSIMVITVVVNVCIQIVTGVVFAFTTEHVIIIVCMVVVLVLLWSSAVAVGGSREKLQQNRHYMRHKLEHSKGLQTLRQLLEKFYVCSYSFNPRIMLVQTSHCQTVGLLCTLTLAVVLEAILKSFALKELRFCDGVSDYSWSIPLVVVTQTLTIIVGGFAVIFRGLTMLNHMSPWGGQNICSLDSCRTLALEYLRCQARTSRFFRKSHTIFRVASHFIISVLIAMQNAVFLGTNLVVIPLFTLKKFVGFTVMKIRSRIPFGICNSNKRMEDVGAMASSLSEIKEFVGVFKHDTVLQNWLINIAMEDMVRWMKESRRFCPSDFIQLLSKTVPQARCMLMEDLRSKTRNLSLEATYEYRVSCVSALVLAGMVAHVTPSPFKESLHDLKEFFELIYFVDRKTNIPTSVNNLRWMADVWAEWNNPNHWFQKKFILWAFKGCSEKTSDESPGQGQAQDESELHHALEVIRNALEKAERYVKVLECFGSLVFMLEDKKMPLNIMNQILMFVELYLICKFILEQEYASIAELYDFIERTFAEMLRFLLRSLPLAILKEVDGGPFEVGEEKVRTYIKLLCKFELLGDKVLWSWPVGSQNKLLLFPVSIGGTAIVASNCGSRNEVSVSSATVTQDGGNNAAPVVYDGRIIEENAFGAIV